MKAIAQPKIIFFNIGWMDNYRGLTELDQIKGGGLHVWEHGKGYEICNFAEHDGQVYGYVQPPKADALPAGGKIDLDRLGGKGLDLISGVLVVWTATDPEEGGTYVIGWYENASVFRTFTKFSLTPDLHAKHGIEGYRVKGLAKDATLLNKDQRTCEIPRAVKGGIGQSNVWYADSEEAKGTVVKVREFIVGLHLGQRGKRNRKTDPIHNAKVEKAAILATWNHYEKMGYELESVEADNKGWDLEATSGSKKLLIEVKGLSGTKALVQLTPNEYKAFKGARANYRLAIVTAALSSPVLRVCSYSSEKSSWIVIDEELSQVDVCTIESAQVVVN